MSGLSLSKDSMEDSSKRQTLTFGIQHMPLISLIDSDTRHWFTAPGTNMPRSGYTAASKRGQYLLFVLSYVQMRIAFPSSGPINGIIPGVKQSVCVT